MFLTTPRLLLRPPWPEDAPAITDAMEWDIARMTSSFPWPFTLEDARRLIDAPDRPITKSMLVISSRDGRGTLLGTAFFIDNVHDGALEIGYWLARAAWGRGLATEAAAALTGFAFETLRLPMLAAGHYVDNPASGTVLAKLGFVRHGGVVPYPCRARGAPADGVDYRLTREQWLARTARRTT